jgi:hypothetical protein
MGKSLWKKLFLGMMLTAWLFSVHAKAVSLAHATTTSALIDLEGFRWNSFPLRVLVDMNEWSRPDYALAVREALDNWVRSIWNYTNTYGDTSLTMIRYVFYVSSVNGTDSCDVLVTFAAGEIASSPDAVGLTTARWNVQTHQPLPPVTVNITTYSATADHVFIRNVAMHEFGHTLGLGHATLQNTLDGPELMYHIPSRNGVLYPSTLDVYGLIMLYKSRYSQTVQLPTSIPYKMLSEGTVPPPTSDFWENLPGYMPLLVSIAIILVLIPILRKMGHKNKPEQTSEEIPPPPDDSTSVKNI